jgi:hypothetical protein
MLAGSGYSIAQPGADFIENQRAEADHAEELMATQDSIPL